MVSPRPALELLGTSVGFFFGLSSTLSTAHNNQLLNSPLTNCGGICDFQLAITSNLVSGILIPAIFFSLGIASFILRWRRIEFIRISTYGGRRTSGLLKETEEVLPESYSPSEAPTSLEIDKSKSCENVLTSEYKNPFDF